MMRSFYCPNLVRIGCNADFLSRFQVSDVSGMYIPLVAGSDRIELRSTEALKMPHFGIFSCSLQERISSNNIKFL